MPRTTAKPFHQMAWAAELGALMRSSSPEDVAEHVRLGRAHGITDISRMALWTAGHYRRLTAMLTQANALSEDNARLAKAEPLVIGAPVSMVPALELYQLTTVARVTLDNMGHTLREERDAPLVQQRQDAGSEHTHAAGLGKRKRVEEGAILFMDDLDDEEVDQLDSDDGEERQEEQGVPLGAAALPSPAIVQAPMAAAVHEQGAYKTPKIRTPPVQGIHPAPAALRKSRVATTRHGRQ